MYIYDYYIIIYDKLFEHEKYYEEFINKKIDNNKLFDYSNVIAGLPPALMQLRAAAPRLAMFAQLILTAASC